jgi:dATP pyrophosphohydrolase
MRYKIPESVLVVIHTVDLQVLIMERADQANFWQSVTGSKNSPEETFATTAAREVKEETGLDVAQFKLTDWHLQNCYDIYPIWQHRYAPGVTKNIEHVFGLTLPQPLAITLAEREHRQYKWLPYKEAADKCFSASNAEAILQLPERINKS